MFTAVSRVQTRYFRSLHYPRRLYSRIPQPTSAEVAELLLNYASSPPRPINLATLLSFGRPLTPESLLSSVSYTLTEIPRRLATRVRSLEGLPFIVGTNPYIAKTLNSFRQSFHWLATYPAVKTLEQNLQFVSQLEQLVQSHADDIPTMAKGFQECSKYMAPAQIGQFLDGAIRNRISVRLIAEQHIALSRAFLDSEADAKEYGVVDLHCCPKKMIEMCGSFVADLCNASYGITPEIRVDGHTTATFAYVPVHLEYILTEVLKNAFRATVEHHSRSNGPMLPPIHITLSPPPPRTHDTIVDPAFFSIRIRDQGGGVSREHMQRIFSYAFTTAGRDESIQLDEGSNGPLSAFEEITGQGIQRGLGKIAGLGYGLPMSRLYASYFGGSLSLVSLEGWGSDVYVKLRCLDEAGDSAI